MPDSKEEVRSYERVFQFDRRIHRIEGWVLPAPIPFAAVGWFFVGVILSLFLSGLPGFKLAWDQISVVLRFIAFPIAIAVAATQIETQGRPIHKFLASWVLIHMRSSRRSLGRVIPREDTVTWIDFSVWVTRDQYSCRLHAATIEGADGTVVHFRDRVWARVDRKAKTVLVRATEPSTVPGADRFGLGFYPTRRIEVPAGATLKVKPR